MGSFLQNNASSKDKNEPSSHGQTPLVMFGISCFVFLSFVLYFNAIQEFEKRFYRLDYTSHEFSSNQYIEKHKIISPINSKHLKSQVQTSSEYFLPGTLNLSRKETLEKCFIDVDMYKNHRKQNICTYSEKYNLFYLLLPKSGSSTGRHVMKYSFDAKEFSGRRCSLFLNGDLDVFEGNNHMDRCIKTISMRNPITRFFASYDEMFVRKLNENTKIPDKYKEFFTPFLGWKYEQYSALFEYKEGVDKLTDAFELFVEDYDGVDPFDVHLILQTAAISKKNGRLFDFDVVFDTKEMDSAFHNIANLVKAPEPEVIRGRSYPRRFNVSRLSDETWGKICELVMIDLCCLNYELPPQCLSLAKKRETDFRCRWTDGDNGDNGERLITTERPY